MAHPERDRHVLLESILYYGTDGHADLFLAFIGPATALMLSVPEGDPNGAHLAASRATLAAAGIEVVDFPFVSGFEDEGRWIIVPYMNFYFCNGGVIVPLAGAEPDKDAEALGFLGRLLTDGRWWASLCAPLPGRAAPSTA
jgi:agmatine deiminase